MVQPKPTPEAAEATPPAPDAAPAPAGVPANVADLTLPLGATHTSVDGVEYLVDPETGKVTGVA